MDATYFLIILLKIRNRFKKTCSGTQGFDNVSISVTHADSLQKKKSYHKKQKAFKANKRNIKEKKNIRKQENRQTNN